MCEKEIIEKTPFWKNRLKRHLPILKWLPKYTKTDLLADMIAGLTLGLTLIPQSVAYAGLAGLSGEYGLYSAFLGSFLYVIFGTVKEVSMGPTSLLALLMFEFTLAKDLPLCFVFLFTFVTGCCELLLGILQFGFLVNFISIPVTTSFQSAVSITIIASQLKDLLGLPKFKSGRFLHNVINVCKRLPQTRLEDTVLSLFCCVFLLSLRKLKDIKVGNENEPTSRQRILEKTLWFISISRNAICVFLCCVIAYVFSVNGGVPFKLSGNIPSGLPSFQPPPFSATIGNETLSFPKMVYLISPGVFIVPLIAILANVTIAKAFSTGTPVDATQEMLTLGICNIIGSFMSSMPTNGAFTRSAVSSSSGVRSPLSGLFTGTLILLTINFLTPYFYYIPRASLASVLICAVLFMIDWKTVLLLWTSNKRDFFLAIITFTSCLGFGIQFGLLLGIALNIGQLLYMWARPSMAVQLKSTSDGIYYSVTPDIGLFFPAIDFIRNEITRQCVQNIPVVIDCLHFKGIDYTAAQGIKEIGRDFKNKEQKVLLTNMSPEIYKMLKKFKVELKSINSGEELIDILFHSEEPETLLVILTSRPGVKEIKYSIDSSGEKALL